MQNASAYGRWNSPVALVVAGGVVMGLALGIRHVQGLFLLPVTMDRAWSREAFGFAIAVQNLVWGLAQPLTGMVADRFGSARVMAGGIACYASGIVLMALAESPAGFGVSAGLVVGAGLSGTAFGTVYGALSRLVPPQRRPWALGLAGAIGGCGQFALVPLAQGLIDGLGWTWALVVLGAAMGAALPLAAGFRDAPAAGPGPRQSLAAALREAFAHRGFRLLTLGFLACGFQLAFIGSHLPAYLMDRGMTARDAAAGLAVIALSNVAGTYWCGHLGGLFRRKNLLSGVYLLRSATMLLFVTLPLTPASLYVFCAFSGFLWLGTVPLTNGLISQVFGVRYIATLFGFVFLGHQVGSFFGVWLGGYVFDRFRSYDLMWAGAILIGIVAALLHRPIDDRAIVRVPAPAGAA